MKAVLLAAGRGERLRPLTDSTPKCLVPVAGTAPLLRNVELLRAHGVVELAVNLHHLPEVVVEALGDGSDFGVRVHYSAEPALLGTAGALRPLRAWLGDDSFILLFADNVLALDLDELLAAHESSGATLTMALFEREDVSASGVAELDAAGRVIAFIEKPPPGVTDSRWVNAGLLACSTRVLDFVPGEGPADFSRDVVPALLADGEPVRGYVLGPDERLVWIDTHADLARAEVLLSGEAAS